MTDIQALLTEREKTHGRFPVQASISQRLKYPLRAGPGWRGLPSFAQEALDMIAHKMARAVNGGELHTDHFVDIAGYAMLVVNELEELEELRD